MNSWKKNYHYWNISLAALSSRTSLGEEGKAIGNLEYRKDKIRWASKKKFLGSKKQKISCIYQRTMYSWFCRKMLFLVDGQTWEIRSRVAAKNKYDIPWDQFCISLCQWANNAVQRKTQTWKFTVIEWKKWWSEYLYRIFSKYPISKSKKYKNQTKEFHPSSRQWESVDTFSKEK